jgi:hypothetical protein
MKDWSHMSKRLLTILMVLMAGLLFLSCEQTTTTTSFAGYNYSDFPELLISDPYTQLNVLDQDYYVYYYGLTCAHCIAIKQEVLTKIALLTQDHVFLVQVSSLSDIMPGIGVTKTPTIIKVVNHQLVSLDVGDTDVLAVFDSLK